MKTLLFTILLISLSFPVYAKESMASHERTGVSTSERSHSSAQDNTAKARPPKAKKPHHPENPKSPKPPKRDKYDNYGGPNYTYVDPHHPTCSCNGDWN